MAVVLIREDLAVVPVAYQGQAGGHPVTENKIRQRSRRLWALATEAVTRCDQATVYDNSAIKGPRIVAQISEGFIVGSPPDRTGLPQCCKHVGPQQSSPPMPTG